MDRDKKITLSLFLTWIVFGLFNLFGQPQAFVPLILVDGLMVVGLGIYFCFPFRKNLFYPGLIIFSAFIFLLSLIELNWISPTMEVKTNSIFLCFGFSLIFFLAAIQNYGLNRLYFTIGMLISFCFTISFALAFFTTIAKLSNPIYVYVAGGLLCLFVVIFNKDQHPTSITFNRVVLVLLLHFLFDIGNYLALLQFQP